MSRFASKMFLFLAIFSLLLIGTPVMAQDDAEESEEQTENIVQFGDEVTVTARKREETAQDVPFSVVAPTEEILRRIGAQDLEDVSANVAGFTVQNLGPGQSQVAIRGVSAGQIVRDQPGVKGAGRRLPRRIGDLAVALHTGHRPV